MILCIICLIVLPAIAAIIAYLKNKDGEDAFFASFITGCVGVVVAAILMWCAPANAPIANVETYPLHTEGQSIYYLNNKNEIEILNTGKRISIEASDEIDKPSFQIVHYDFTIWPLVVTYKVLIPGE